jgi:hypothetical protein
MPGKEQKKMRLTDDGEIVDLNTLLQEDNETEDSHETQAQPIYCTNCGAGNLSDAKYCRACGKALALQEMKTPPPPPPARPRMVPPAPRMAMDAMEPLASIKRKNEDFYEPQMMMQGRPPAAWASALRFWTMLMMGSVLVCSFVFNVSWAIIPTLIAWFLVESVRGDKSHQLNFTSFWSEAVTAGVMAAAAILAFVFEYSRSTSWAVIPIMIAWFLVTAVRSDSLGK